MAAHMSDWSDLMNQRRRGGKLLNMVVIFVGCFVLGDDRNIVLFLMYITYKTGVFHSFRNPYGLFC